MKTSLKFQREPLSLRINRTIKALIVTLSIMIVVLATFFLAMISSSGQRGYELKQLQIENRELESEMERLKRMVTETLSFQKVEESTKIKEMQKPEQKIYIQK